MTTSMPAKRPKRYGRAGSKKTVRCADSHAGPFGSVPTGDELDCCSTKDDSTSSTESSSTVPMNTWSIDVMMGRFHTDDGDIWGWGWLCTSHPQPVGLCGYDSLSLAMTDATQHVARCTGDG